MNEFDTRGRMIAHSFWTEMEKISSFRSAMRSGNSARREASQYARDTGMGSLKKRFGRGQRASLYREKKRRAKDLQREGIEGMKERAVELRALDHAGELDSIGKKELSSIERAFKSMRRGGSSIPKSPPRKVSVPSDGKPMPLPKKMAIGAGLGLGTAGAVAGNKRYQDYKKRRGYGQSRY